MNTLTAWKTPKGNRFLLSPLPWTRAALLEWEQWREWGDWPENVPVMPPLDASRYLEEAEAYHAPHGFFVLPSWGGVRVPDSCPGMVALDLQACFLASTYDQDGQSGARGKSGQSGASIINGAER